MHLILSYISSGMSVAYLFRWMLSDLSLMRQSNLFTNEPRNS